MLPGASGLVAKPMVRVCAYLESPNLDPRIHGDPTTLPDCQGGIYLEVIRLEQDDTKTLNRLYARLGELFRVE